MRNEGKVHSLKCVSDESKENRKDKVNGVGRTAFGIQICVCATQSAVTNLQGKTKSYRVKPYATLIGCMIMKSKGKHKAL